MAPGGRTFPGVSEREGWGRKPPLRNRLAQLRSGLDTPFACAKLNHVSRKYRPSDPRKHPGKVECEVRPRPRTCKTRTETRLRRFSRGQPRRSPTACCPLILSDYDSASSDIKSVPPFCITPVGSANERSQRCHCFRPSNCRENSPIPRSTSTLAGFFAKQGTFARTGKSGEIRAGFLACKIFASQCVKGVNVGL